MILTSSDIKEFQQETGLIIRPYKLGYMDVSGKSYNIIKNIISRYNRNHSGHHFVMSSNDYHKDLTEIRFVY